MKILITGGTTFVSKFTAEYFVSKNNEVFVLNRGNRAQIEGVKHLNCDRMNLNHLLKDVNFDLILDITAYTEEQIKTLVESGVKFKDYIFISSSAVYPETNSQPFIEYQLCGYNRIWGDYGLNKLNAERYLIENVPNAYILRPPYFYGKYDNLYREAFVFDCAINNRKFYIPRDGSMNLQFFNVVDLCRFIEILLKEQPENHIFNVGNKESISVKNWVELCYKAVGKKPEFVSVKKDIPQRNYFCFYDYEYMLDVSKQTKLMPETIPLEQGLKDEFNWYKNNQNCVYNRKPYIDFINKNLL